MSENKELAVVELPKELAELKNSVTGLSVDKADKILMAFAPSMTRLTELSQEMEKINFTTPTDFDAEVAGSLRKKLVKVRTGAADEKDSQKELIKIEDKLIMSSFNLIKSACVLKENRLREVEEFQKREQERLMLIKQEERSALLDPYNQAFDKVMIGAMSEEVFSNYLAGVKASHEAKLEAERKAEEQRLEQERITNLHNQRKEALIHVWGFLSADQRIMNFGILSSEDFNQLLGAAEERRMADELQREKERAEAERLRKENEAAQAKAKAEREEAEAKLRAEQEKARKEKEAAELKAKQEREALEAKLAAERAEKARLELEARQKEIDAQKAKEAEEKARKLAEKKAANAPDKKKLEVFLSEMCAVKVPEMKTEEGKAAREEIDYALTNLRMTIEKRISEL